ncbi:MAG: hypothetical protein ABIC91_04405 [Nanoarchaeota archaeon]|nr:hypothetical protein [Nanoarchaeota archaeon]MBU1030559.1 hypothetical protein [Nanoarchaeota archaeon]MBU1849484.1 hypothetical protein [Nanoarchaeota archaeon]
MKKLIITILLLIITTSLLISIINKEAIFSKHEIQELDDELITINNQVALDSDIESEEQKAEIINRLRTLGYIE